MSDKKEIADVKLTGEKEHTTKFTFKKIKSITRPLLKQLADVPLYVKIEGVMTQSIKHPKDKSDKEPPILADVINLETGESMQIICPEVLKSELQSQYEQDAYVGKCFEIIKHEKATGKQYSTFSITEIEV